jgi:hypothetical protein
MSAIQRRGLGVHFSLNPTGAIFGAPTVASCNFAAVLVALVVDGSGRSPGLRRARL